MRAQLAAATAEAQAQTEKADLLHRELDQRMAEKGRWQAQTADVDKDRALLERNLADWEAEGSRYKAAVDAHNARLGSIGNDPAAAAAYNAEKAEGDAWQSRLQAGLVRLQQAEADLETRYGEIEKQVAALNARIAELSDQTRQARDAATIAQAQADYLKGVLAAQDAIP
ncbi:hypothetical protein ACLB0R_08140 [Sphingomonas sp. GlSt437]|uniref:hypothetical protein n=1 Tax=Sphingomonas sp. GlSt437 TaxID=3389970 RepID=UPI003A841868